MRGQTWYLDDIPIGYVHVFGAAPIEREDIAVFEQRFGPALPMRPGESSEGAAPQALIYAIWTRLIWSETQDWPVTARFGQDALRWINWARAGDVLSVRLTIKAKQIVNESLGMLFAQHEVLNQNGGLILSLMTRTELSRRAGPS